MRASKAPSRTSVLLNGGAILVIVSTLGAVVHSYLSSNEAPPCRERYDNGLRFSLLQNGVPISAAQLQSEAGNTDWGLTSAVRAVSLKSGPTKQALEFDLSDALTLSEGSASKRPGFGFQWSPDALANRHDACLAYSVFVPEEFAFGKGGRLPGLLGGVPKEFAAPTPTFSVRYSWGSNGQLEVYPQLPNAKEGRPVEGSFRSLALRPGQWTELQQEVMLNSPGRNDGVLRIWQDGRLVFENKKMLFRVRPAVSMAGVLAEVAAGDVADDQKKAPRKLWLSPFEVRWHETKRPGSTPLPPAK